MRFSVAVIFLLSCFFFQACTGKRNNNSIDFSNPVKVVQVIFDAARNKDSSRLSLLCHSNGQYDGDVRDICEMNPKHKKWGQFLRWFAKGEVVGKPIIRKNHAQVKFMFGPLGKDREKMSLVQYDGKWYLSGY